MGQEYKENREKLKWYEIELDVIPEGKRNLFYVTVNEYEEYYEGDHRRFSITPHIGNYDNCNEYWKAVSFRYDIERIIIADTIMTKEEALKLEKNLVLGLRSCNEEYGFYKERSETI